MQSINKRKGECARQNRYEEDPPLGVKTKNYWLEGEKDLRGCRREGDRVLR